MKKLSSKPKSRVLAVAGAALVGLTTTGACYFGPEVGLEPLPESDAGEPGEDDAGVADAGPTVQPVDAGISVDPDAGDIEPGDGGTVDG